MMTQLEKVGITQNLEYKVFELEWKLDVANKRLIHSKKDRKNLVKYFFEIKAKLRFVQEVRD